MTTTLNSLEVPPAFTVDGTQYTTELLLPSEQIQDRVKQMGHELADRYAERGEIHVLTVLNGALHFASDLRRAIQSSGGQNLAVTSEQFRVSSYTNMQSSGVIRQQSPPPEVAGKHVLIAEDILDSGRTLAWLIGFLNHEDRAPASIEVAVAINKDVPTRPQNILGETVVHSAFTIPDKFVIGYGLDLDEQYRDISSIYALVPSQMTK